MINVDISNIWGEIALPDLLAAEKEVFDAHMALTESPDPEAPLPGWMALPQWESTEDFQRLMDAADRIRKTSDALVVLGSSPACRGAQGAIDLLQGSARNLCRDALQIFYAGNSFSTRQWQALLKLLEGKDFSVCVICESDADIEPIIALRNLRWLMERKYGTDETRKRIFAISAEENSTLTRMAQTSGWEHFPIPAGAAGPFAVLSPAGLLPMASAGLDLSALLRGAQAAKETYDLRSFENPVWLYAAVRHLLQRGEKQVELLETFEPDFASLGAWWQQLFCSNHSKLFPTAIRLPGDLPSLDRQIREGAQTLFETVVRFDPPETQVIIGEDAMDLDGLNYLAGKSQDVLEECVCGCITQSHADSGVPVIAVDCGALTEETLGELFWFFQLSSALYAHMPGAETPNRTEESYRSQLLTLLGKPVQEDSPEA